MEFEFDKYCVVDGSPTTVLPSPRPRLKSERRKSKGNSKCSKEKISVDGEFTEIRFDRYRSVSCKDVPSRKLHSEGSEALKRGSVYQSSKEVRRINKTDAVEERRKIEFSRGNATSLSFGIVDALCRSDEDSSLVEKHRSSFHPIPERCVPSDCSEGSSLNYEDRENRLAQNPLSRSARDSNIMSQSVVDNLREVNRLTERNPSVSLPKSLSTKLTLPHSAAQSESDCSRSSSSQKSRFSPIRKMFDPFGKSKSLKSPLSYSIEQEKTIQNELVNVSRSNAFHKSMLHDISSRAQLLDQPIKKEIHNSNVHSLPAHLHGLLRLDKKNGLPFFEFSVKFPGDIFVAKTSKVENTLSWVYTFHSHHKRKSNASGWGLKYNTRESSLVGEMRVSCHLCTDLKNAGDCDNLMVTEFVLYDMIHSRKSFSSQDSCCSSPDVTNAPKTSGENLSGGNCGSEGVPGKTKPKSQSKHGHDRGHLDSSTPYPLAVADMQPQVEIAAIAIEVPIEKRDTLKFRNGDTKADQLLPNLLDVCKRVGPCDTLSPAKVNVVIPSGHHGLPITESPGPSPLLDRWRTGGGCDCGGWDMACPLHILSNPSFHAHADHSLINNQQPFELFIRGRKDKDPALTMTIVEDGQYSVDFHAQLSALQAFSICVATLHSMETSMVGPENNVESLKSNTRRVFVQDDINGSPNAVREEEKPKIQNKVEQVFPSFVLNPPFSPISRA